MAADHYQHIGRKRELGRGSARKPACGRAGRNRKGKLLRRQLGRGENLVGPAKLPHVEGHEPAGQRVGDLGLEAELKQDVVTDADEAGGLGKQVGLVQAKPPELWHRIHGVCDHARGLEDVLPAELLLPPPRLLGRAVVGVHDGRGQRHARGIDGDEGLAVAAEADGLDRLRARLGRRPDSRGHGLPERVGIHLDASRRGELRSVALGGLG